MKTALSWQQTTTVEVELDVDDVALCDWAIATLDLRTLGGEISAAELRRSAAANPQSNDQNLWMALGGVT